MLTFGTAVPVLQVQDVAKSIAWYRQALGFSGDPFPAQPPFSFAILRRDKVEIMLQGGQVNGARPTGGWAIYLRLAGGELLALAKNVQQHTPLLRKPERMFYGQVEFEIADPDGHRICIAEALPSSAPVPLAAES